MDNFLLSLLLCNKCGKPFRLTITKKEDERILEGYLECDCLNRFMIVNSIPRFIYDINDFKKIEAIKKFGYEWVVFKGYDLNNFFRWLPKEINRDFFNGKTGLDVGCGMGRHLKIAKELGAKMIGIDISRAVDIAYEKNKDKGQFLIIQCDIDSIPLPQETFDFIYSLGVLHHLLNPEDSFCKLLPLLKPGGVIFIWVYQKTLRKILLEHVRVITKRLPNCLLHLLATFLSILDYYFFILPYRIISKTFDIEQYCPSHIKEYAQHNYKICQTDWFDRLSAPVSHFYTAEEIKKWFIQTNLKDISIEIDADFGWKVYGRKSM